MVRWNTILVAVAAVTAAAPFATATTTATGCAVQSDPNAVPVGDRFYLKARVDGYIVIQVWGETNDAAGLQTSPSPCGYRMPMLPADNKIGDATNAIQAAMLLPGLIGADALFEEAEETLEDVTSGSDSTSLSLAAA